MRGRSLAGCVPILSDNRLCLITSRHNPEDLLFPKGSVKHGETDVEAAQRETLEEAGVEGRIVGDLGLFEGIHWFILRVDKIHDRWPEMQERARLFVGSSPIKILNGLWVDGSG